jgi:CHAD domain-containing protein
LSAAVRIRAKRLRYALGPLKDWPEAAEVVRMLKERQDLLGELHDRHAFALVLERMLAQAPAPQLQVGLDALMQKAHAEGHELYLQYGQHRHQSDVRLAALLDLMSERLGKRLGLHVEVVPQGD